MCEELLIRWLRWPSSPPRGFFPAVGELSRDLTLTPPPRTAAACGTPPAFSPGARVRLCGPSALLPASALLAPLLPRVNVLLAVSDGTAHTLLGQLASVLDQLAVASARGLAAYVLLGAWHFTPLACPNELYDEGLSRNTWEFYFAQARAAPPPSPPLPLVFPRAQARAFASHAAAIDASAARLLQLWGGAARGSAARASELISRARQLWRWVRPQPWLLHAARRLLRPLAASSVRVGALLRDASSPHGVPWRTARRCIDAALRATRGAARGTPRVVLFGASEAEAARLARQQYSVPCRVARAPHPRALAAAAEAALSARARGAVALRGGARNGTVELLHALLLAHSDFLLAAPSLAADFAQWYNPALLSARIELGPRCDSAPPPPPPAAAAAEAARERRLLPLFSPNRSAAMRQLLGEGGAGAYAPGLAPAEARVRRAPPPPWVLVERGRGCASAKGRLMSEAECRQYARAVQLDFIGVGVERSEYPGCVIWESARVEFNAHANERGGCSLGSRGKCACWKVSAR
ncbi:hypothetical protein AB1Y20_015794 [Prymnesium parvum]|uniref:Uncharacterized protein n=1 Tax=Prymnesium parvum TaxID=97485 RepID=A0AB34K1J1_PRYPA